MIAMICFQVYSKFIEAKESFVLTELWIRSCFAPWSLLSSIICNIYMIFFLWEQSFWQFLQVTRLK